MPAGTSSTPPMHTVPSPTRNSSGGAWPRTVDRKQERIENAHAQLQAFVACVWVWAEHVCPMWDTVPPQLDPPFPDSQREAHVRTLVRQFASDKVQAKFEIWHDVVQKMIEVVGGLKSADTRSDANRLRRVLDLELRAQARETSDALMFQIRRELGHG